MFIELIDVLRCPRSHEESWLVLAARYLQDRDVLEGVLGCPVCAAEYEIVDGIARFEAEARVAAVAEPSTEEEAVRLAALLDLATPRGYAIVGGALGTNAPRLRALTDVPLLLVNPPAGIEIGHGVSGLTIAPDWRALPLAASSARAIALDGSTTPDQLIGVLPIVRPGGRILAPAALPLPDGVSELARDDRHWLAQRSAAPRESAIIPLARRK